ncbi:MAG: 16S rRNA (uracil(1498)-N(3))-methyltransferase [Acidimicrobiales bacterium]
MDEALRTSAAHVFVSPAALEQGDGPDLDADARHHLERVLRLRTGEPVSVSDGAGRWRLCRWQGSGVVVDGDIRVVEAELPAITIGFVPVKGERPEWTVQKLTEIGVDRIIPLRSARSVVKWEGPRGAAQVERLRRVAREASAQARRCHVPRIDEVTAPPAIAGAVLAQFGGRPLGLDRPTVLIGPEGGWSDAEVAAGETVTLGGTVLRAETAALAAAVVLCTLRTRTVVMDEHGPWS